MNPERPEFFNQDNSKETALIFQIVLISQKIIRENCYS